MAGGGYRLLKRLRGSMYLLCLLIVTNPMRVRYGVHCRSSGSATATGVERASLAPRASEVGCRAIEFLLTSPINISRQHNQAAKLS